jgi:hypothetical protein
MRIGGRVGKIGRAGYKTLSLETVQRRKLLTKA